MSETSIITGATAFAADIYDIEAVKRAAYQFSNRISVEITKDEREIRCFIRALSHAGVKNLDDLIGEFRNEVLDQDLRIRIAAETEGYRNLVLSLAFSKTPLNQ